MNRRPLKALLNAAAGAVSPMRKYPQVRKAYLEQVGVSTFLGGSPDKSYTALVNDYVRVADQYIALPDAQKEAIMVGCVLASGSVFVFDDMRRFDTDYTPEVKKIAYLILRGPGDDPLQTESQAQEERLTLQYIQAVTFIAVANRIPSRAAEFEAEFELRPKEEAFAELSLLKDAAPALLARVEGAYAQLDRLSAQVKKPGPTP